MRLYEITATDPAEIQMLQRLSQKFGIANATSLTDLNNKLEQRLIDKCATRMGLPPGSTVDQVLAAQQKYVKNVLPGIQADRTAELAKIKGYSGLSAQEILKRELPAMQQIKAAAGRAVSAAAQAGWLEKIGSFLGVAGRAAAAVTGVGATLATYTGGLNTGEDEELVKRRRMAPTITPSSK
jgi:hypothetical protein